MPGSRLLARGTIRAAIPRVQRLVTVLCLATAACGGGDGDRVDAGPQPDAGPNDHRADRVGVVDLAEQGDSASAYALVQDRGQLPTPMVTATSDECVVYTRPDPALCDPPCSTGVCTQPDVCTPYGQHASAGTITVTGLVAALAFTEGAFGYVPEPEPGTNLFEAGAAITVSAPGATTPGFTANVTGVAPLAAPFQNLTLVDDEDATITWTAAGSGEIRIELVVGWHGAPYEAMLACETADDGSFVLPGSIIAQLPRASSGLEQHGSWIARYSRSVVQVPAGPIEVIAQSRVALYFNHP